MEKKITNILVALVCGCCGLYADAQGNTGDILCGDHYVAAPENDPESNEKYRLIMQAKQASFEGDNDKATDLYLKALEIDPKCDACHYELANIRMFTGKERQARQNAEAAYNLDADNPWFALLYGQLCFHFREYDKARNLFRQTLTRHGNKQEIWLGLASAYEGQGLFREALNVLDSMIIRFGENDDISYRLFNISMNVGEYDRAIEEVNKLVNNYPDDPRFATLLADAYFETGRDSLAIEAYNRAIEADESFAPALLGKAESFRKKGSFVRYFKSLQQYARNRNIAPEAKAEYIELILKIPSFADYFKSNLDTIFAILTIVHPVSTELKFLQARYFASTQRPEQAISVFSQLVGMDETNKSAWIGLLSMEYSMKRFDILASSSEKAISSDPEYADFYMYSALAQWSRNKVKPAIDILEKGIAEANYDSVFMDNALSFLGDMYFSIRKSKKAFAYYDKALLNNPENAAVLNNYAYYLCLNKSKNLDKAYKMSKKAIELESSNSSFLDTFAYILFLQGKYTEAKTMFRQALAAGGDESAVVLDHYADTLDKLGERTTAEIYWSQALDKPDCVNPDMIKKKLNKN
ncbi:MAG: tetratricopeptide repeat protein [Prevotellaceae bacterium]|nr:tetratricopeptide repeat protein [Prevotellaceae bacterium]